MTTKAILIPSINEEDYKLLKQLIDKLGLTSTTLTDEELEDLGLLVAMLREPREDYVPESEIRKALDRS